MKSALWSIATWTALAVGVWFVTRQPSDTAIVALMVFPTLALLGMVNALRHAPRWRLLRIGWWLITVLGWAILTILTNGVWEHSHDDAELREMMFAGVLLLIGVTVWLAIRVRGISPGRVAIDATSALLILAVITAAYLGYRHHQWTGFAAKAEARWGEIGRPMAAFGQTIRSEPGNASLQIFGDVLHEQLGAGLYKHSNETEGYTTPITTEAVAVIHRVLPLADEIAPSSELTPELDARASQLDAAYARLLAAEPPLWAAEPMDGFEIQVPNFLALRVISQIIAADATRRLERGDIAGANRALSAGLHGTARLSENPTIVSVMISVAVDALLSPRKVRLPAEAGAFEKLQRDAARLRAELADAIQLNSWHLLRMAKSDTVRALAVNSMPQEARRLLPQWILGKLTMPDFRRQCCAAALAEAESVRMLAEPATLGLPDLGAAAWDGIVDANDTAFTFNFIRSHQRLTATLLLREQMELLRIARKNLAAGLPLNPHASVVLPGRRWDFIVDRPQHRAALRLDEVPDWIANNSVTNGDFWLLPLDGSKHWQFRRPSSEMK